ncbi:MAG: hypothetical protein GC151_01880 [Betaproteobacteria bacterium]|nr:hypothetical protein [Betaproteobacteria bacterium]
MSLNTQDFVAPAKAQVETAIRAATIASDTAARLFELNTKTARATFDELTSTVQALANVKDPSELRTFASKAMKPEFEKGQAYVREVYEQLASTQAELASLVETQVTEFNKQMVVTMDGLMKSAPPGSEVFVSAFKSAMTGANQAYEATVSSLREVGKSVSAATATSTSGKRKAA